jgi:PIN domain nuclease of toxin-antitoxin system
MAGVGVDAHTVVWFLSRTPGLSAKARDVLRSTTAAGGIIIIPSIFLVELTYLVEKGRLPVAARDEPYRLLIAKLPKQFFQRCCVMAVLLKQRV